MLPFVPAGDPAREASPQVWYSGQNVNKAYLIGLLTAKDLRVRAVLLGSSFSSFLLPNGELERVGALLFLLKFLNLHDLGNTQHPLTW